MQLFNHNSGDYILSLVQNEVLPHELAIANTDYSMHLIDLNTAQVAPLQRQHFHTDKIHSLKYSNDSNNEHLQHVLFSASADGTVKLWDRRNGESVAQLRHNNQAWYSVDCNKQIICAGGNSELVFWDVRKLKPPLFSYMSSHTDDITQVRFHKENPNWMLTCSTDNLMCHFDFANKPDASNEEETMEGVYASSQPLIDCGFINQDKFWTLTSINTIEVINVENCDTFTKVEKFPHQVQYVIGCQLDRFTNKFVIYAGNNRGEVYIYDLEDKNKMNLVDMLLIQPNEQNQDIIIRNTLRVTAEQIALSTESGELKLFKYSPEEAKLLNPKPKFEFEEDNGDMDDQEENKGKTKKRFKPF